MLSFNDVVNIVNRLPVELVSITFSYLNGFDMVNFINDNKETYINDLNIMPCELNIWNVMKYSKSDKNKLFEWCRILFHANINSLHYKFQYDQAEDGYYKRSFSLPSDKDKKYNRKLNIGLFLFFGLDIIKAYNYSSLSNDKIEMIFNIIKKMPEQFTINILCFAVNLNKHLEPIENYINYATKIKEICDIVKENFMTPEHFIKVILDFQDEPYQRLISLLEYNISFETAFILSNPSRNYPDALVEKFKQLNEEFNIRDDILVRYLRDNKAISNIRLFKSKNISEKGINSLLNRSKDLLDYIIKNDKIFDFDFELWNKLEHIFTNDFDVFEKIFTTFTIKQQTNLRMKELMEDGGYNELFNSYIKENVEKVYKRYINNIPNNAMYLLTTSQCFQVYTELTEFQMNTFLGFLKLKFTFDEALSNTYQVVEYNY